MIVLFLSSFEPSVLENVYLCFSLFSPMLFNRSNSCFPTGISKPKSFLPIPRTCLVMYNIKHTRKFPNLKVPFLSPLIYFRLSINSSLSHSHTSILALSLTMSYALLIHRLDTEFNLFACVALQPKIILINLTLMSITSFTLRDFLSNVVLVRSITMSFRTLLVLSGLLSKEGNPITALTTSLVIL